MKNRDATLSANRLDNQEMGLRSRRRRLGLLTLASFALPVWLALAAHPAFAAVGGRSNNANINLPVNMWTTLNQIPLPASDVVRYCMAVGSADVSHPNANVATTYLFTLWVDDPQPPMNGGQERTVQFLPLPDDVRIKEVTTTYAFTLAANVAHTIFWLGRPAPMNPPTLVLDRSMSLVCDGQTVGGIINLNPEPLID